MAKEWELKGRYFVESAEFDMYIWHPQGHAQQEVGNDSHGLQGESPE